MNDILEENPPLCSNKIQVTQFGLNFIKSIPQRIHNQSEYQNSQKQTPPPLSQKITKINFRKFTIKTQSMLQSSLSSTLKQFRKKTETPFEEKRKKVLYHENWMSQQQSAKNRLVDEYDRMMRQKNKDYNWKAENNRYKNIKENIVKQWEKSTENKERRTLSKVRKIFFKKYSSKKHIRTSLVKNRSNQNYERNYQMVMKR